MSANFISQLPGASATEQQSLISNIVDRLYNKMLDDYRINRYFYSRPLEEQTKPLKTFLYAAVGINKVSNTELSTLLDEYFFVAFARGNAKPSAVSGRDFGFLLEIMDAIEPGGKEIRPVTLLCPSHSHLLKLQPQDENFDVVLELLSATLQELNLADGLASKIIAFAEAGREGLMGRGEEIAEAA